MLLMVVISLTLILIFRRKKWF
ncbi:TPA: hypothetical protein DEP21_03150 [Patescibacteria group bacterium]|nr:hypothetical protein [Candidatus Gracilibacteria bacterium]